MSRRIVLVDHRDGIVMNLTRIAMGWCALCIVLIWWVVKGTYLGCRMAYRYNDSRIRREDAETEHLETENAWLRSTDPDAPKPWADPDSDPVGDIQRFAESVREQGQTPYTPEDQEPRS